jgi:hypothetical protein
LPRVWAKQSPHATFLPFGISIAVVFFFPKPCPLAYAVRVVAYQGRMRLFAEIDFFLTTKILNDGKHQNTFPPDAHFMEHSENQEQNPLQSLASGMGNFRQ